MTMKIIRLGNIRYEAFFVISTNQGKRFIHQTPEVAEKTSQRINLTKLIETL